MHWSPREKKVEEKVPDDQKNDFLTQSVWPEEELKKHDEISGPLYAVSLFDHALSKVGPITHEISFILSYARRVGYSHDPQH